MNGKRQKIVHVFEDKLCRFCTKSCGIKYYNVFDNLLMYKQNPISFETIINVVLDLNVEIGDGKSHFICDCCKFKLIDFYDFKSQCRQEEADIHMEADIKISDSPEPLLQTSTSRPRMIKEIKHNDSINTTVDTEVKNVLVLFISILTKENLWMEHDKKFNKWNGQLKDNIGQHCLIPRKYGDKCGVQLNSFYKYLAHVIMFHLLENFCPHCKTSFYSTNSLADHFQKKCLSRAKAAKHEKYRQSFLQQYSP